MADPLPGGAGRYDLLDRLLAERAGGGLEAENARLREENAQLRAKVDLLEGQVRRMQDATHLDYLVRQCPHVKPERETIVALAREYESAVETKKVDPDGYALIRLSSIAPKIGRNPRSVSRDLGVIKALGLGDLRHVRGPGRDVGVDGDGVIQTLPTTDVYFRPAGGARTMRERAAKVTAEERLAATGKANTHGGTRTVRCPDHPDAAIRKTWQTHCAVCDKPLDRGEEFLRPDPQPPVDQAPPDNLSAIRKGPDLTPHRCASDLPPDNLSGGRGAVPNALQAALIEAPVWADVPDPIPPADDWDVEPDPGAAPAIEGARNALGWADHAPDRDAVRQTNDDLAAFLEPIARAKGREPVPKRRPGGTAGDDRWSW